MKAAACILFIIFAALNLELAFNSDRTVVENTRSCMKKCTKDKSGCGNNDCTNNRCNPFMVCLYGNYFLNNKYSFAFTLPAIKKEKIVTLNDFRLSTALSECWHPPEYFHFIA